jgi:3-deoxy-D-manno-octulosonic acid (KDO) 8-phosphate synthase
MEHKKTSHLKPWNIKKTSHLKPWNIKIPLTTTYDVGNHVLDCDRHVDMM